MNFEKLSLEMIKALRGKRSQNELSVKLGYDFNQYHRWEAGTKKFNWEDFINTCKVQKIDLHAIFAKEFAFKGILKASLLIKHVLSDNELKTVAKFVGISEKKIKEFLLDKQIPTLSFMLQIIYQYMGLYFFKLINGVTDPRLLQELSNYIYTVNEYYKITMEKPYLFGFPRCLDLLEYKNLNEHKKNFIANKLGLTEQEEEDALNVLEKLGLIKKVSGKWINILSNHVVFSSEKLDPSLVKKYWFEKSIRRIFNPPKGASPLNGKSTISVIYLDDEDLEALEQTTAKYLAKINGVKDSQNKDEKNIRVVCISIFDPSNDA